LSETFTELIFTENEMSPYDLCTLFRDSMHKKRLMLMPSAAEVRHNVISDIFVILIYATLVDVTLEDDRLLHNAVVGLFADYLLN